MLVMAASELVEKLDRQVLECGICLHRYQEPRGLPCLHCFCHQCLEQLCKGKKQILCPNCKKPVRVQKEGVAGFPAHFIMNTIQETLDLEKLKFRGPMADMPCSNCGQPDKKATVRCLDCNEFFCQTCHTYHDGLKAMQNHKTVNMKDLQSGKVQLPLSSSHDQKCKDHDGEIKKFYCETCKKPVCRDCIVMKQHCRDHDYIIMKEASEKQVATLSQLAKEAEEIQKEYQDAIQKTEAVETNFITSSKEADKQIDFIHTRYRKQVDAYFYQTRNKLSEVKVARKSHLQEVKEELQTSLAEVKSACELANKVIQMGSHYDIASNFQTLSVSLKEYKTTKPKVADEMLGYVGVQEITKLEVPDVVGVFKGECWKQTGQIKNETLPFPCGITFHPKGHIALTNVNCHVKVLSQTGDCKHTIKLDQQLVGNMHDIAITPDNRYVLPGDGEILFYSSEGNRLNYPKAPTYDVNNQPSIPVSLAVDSRGRIIAGLKGNTISIHHADGQPISKFATSETPNWLAVTSMEDIAVNNGNILQVMDYSGNIVKTVQPPKGVTSWSPGSVCCSKQGELFVVNDGDPKAVYRYTADGDQCLGCIITGLEFPKGIAISEDGQQLFIVECIQEIVKIFQRQDL